MNKSLENEIKHKLEEEYVPKVLKIENLSHLHVGHESIRGNTSLETHFKIYLVSNKFSGTSLIERHKMVYKTLNFAFEKGLHALELELVSDTKQTSI